MLTIMNWNRLLHDAWKNFYAKNKKNDEDTSSYIKLFSNTYKKRLAVIERHLKRKDYSFGKWKATLIPKQDGSYRPLIIPKSINDKIVLKAISDYLSKTLSYLFNRVSTISYAYQKGKSTRDALIQLKRMHHAKNALLKIDIKHFFDEIDKTILLDLLDQQPIDNYVKDLICKGINPIVDYSSIKKDDIGQFSKGGIPQGNPISSVLSNLYLYELDRLTISKGWKMVRYADDMVFSVSDLKEAQLVLSQVEEYLLKYRSLTIHPLENSSDAKTAIFLKPKKQNMKYLGVIFDGQDLYPTKECCYKIIGRIKTILKSAATSEEKAIAIKTAIAQWCGYYAFTDISDNQIKWMSNAINHHIYKSKFSR